MCRDYSTENHATRTALQVALAHRWCSIPSLTTFLNAILAANDCEPITDATVKNWTSGRENMPAEAFARFVEHCAPHSAAVLDTYGRALTEPLSVRRLPGPQQSHAEAVDDLRDLLARLQSLVAQATHIRSEEGRDLSANEKAAIRPVLAELGPVLAEADRLCIDGAVTLARRA
jgi:hypothetical protein